jgi:coenzyme F420-reducing hydrogenase gamma subunit
MADKIKIAQYWGAGCGGCDVALLDIDAKILDVHAIAEVVFWPIGFDGKLHEIEQMPDKSITVSFYNGAIRNSENEHVAKVLREKSVIMISFGSCACFGGTPGLANVTNREEIFQTVYKDTASTDNPDFVTPQTKLNVPEGELTLPRFYDSVKTLDEVVDVDYFMPGCPPTVNLIALAVDAVAKHVTEGAPLPPKGGEEQAHREDIPVLRDQGRPGEVPARPGHNLHRARHPRGLRGDVPERQHALQGLHGADEGCHGPRWEHAERGVVAPEHHGFGVNAK